jgi:hypothetical protein
MKKRGNDESSGAGHCFKPCLVFMLANSFLFYIHTYNSNNYKSDNIYDNNNGNDHDTTNVNNDNKNNHGSKGLAGEKRKLGGNVAIWQG